MVKLTSGVSVSGEVVSLEKQGGGRQSQTFDVAVIYEYQGREYHHQQRVGAGIGARLKQGGSVPVVCSPDDPSVALLGPKPGAKDVAFYLVLALISLSVSGFSIHKLRSSNS